MLLLNSLGSGAIPFSMLFTHFKFKTQVKREIQGTLRQFRFAEGIRATKVFERATKQLVIPEGSEAIGTLEERGHRDTELA